MCGREENLILVELEGSRLQVCSSCGKHGKRIGRTEIKKVVKVPKRPKIVKEEIEEVVVSDFAVKLRKAREKRGLKQEDFANLLNEKASLLQKWENGILTPKIPIAKKLERMLGIKFIKQVKESKLLSNLETKSGEMTLGDFVKVRKRS
tara:strand:+ start:1554 stop:2000 length:447 start_codon:yes stop_codon:yes gene_type:complete